MTDKSPADELLEVLQQHRQKNLQPPPDPQWEDAPQQPQSEPPPEAPPEA